MVSNELPACSSYDYFGDPGYPSDPGDLGYSGDSSDSGDIPDFTASGDSGDSDYSSADPNDFSYSGILSALGDNLLMDFDLDCIDKFLSANYKDFKAKVGFKKPCNVLEYDGVTMADKTFEKGQYWISYRFAQPERINEFKERLVFDSLGLIAYVGGTLGMCIGFSFIGTISNGLDLIKNRIETLI